MVLYKYFQPNEYAFRSLAARGLWCHYPAMMNDPFECLGLVGRDFSKADLEKFRDYVKFSTDPLMRKLLLLNDSLLSETINKFRKKSVEKFAFCALSEDYDNILLWSHYTSGHKGFVIGFEFPELKDNHHLRKVRYLNKLEDFDLIKWAEELMVGNPNQSYLMDDISVKSKEWSYEKEWRLWRKFPCYYNFQPDQIKAIYLGINCHAETKSILAYLTSYVNKDTMYYEMEFDEKNIKLKW